MQSDIELPETARPPVRGDRLRLGRHRGAGPQGGRERAPRASIEALCALGMDALCRDGHPRRERRRPAGGSAERPRPSLSLRQPRLRGLPRRRGGPRARRATRSRRAEEEARSTPRPRRPLRRSPSVASSAEIVSQRLNRRKIDLIPEPEWADPPKARIGDLLRRCRAAPARRPASRGCPRQSSSRPRPRARDRARRRRASRATPSTSRSAHRQGRRRSLGLRRPLAAGRLARARARRRRRVRLPRRPARQRFASARPGVRPAPSRPVGAEPTGSAARRRTRSAAAPTRSWLCSKTSSPAAKAATFPTSEATTGWTLTVDGLDSELERVHEALLVLADGRIGTNGAPVWTHPPRRRACSPRASTTARARDASCCRRPSGTSSPRSCPQGARLDACSTCAPASCSRRSRRRRRRRGDLFSSLARPGTVALRVAGPSGLTNGGHGGSVRPTGTTERASEAGVAFAVVPASTGGVAAAAANMTTEAASNAWAPTQRPRRTARRRDGVFASCGRCPRARLRAPARASTARRGPRGGRMPTSSSTATTELQLRGPLRALPPDGVRRPTAGEAAVGARGLTGEGYRGHVFWDTDVFVLPFLAATHPPAARAILEYRIRRLPAALRAARALGVAGARFPWESARDGTDVTPSSARDRPGGSCAIRTGEIEEHVVADVAWAAACYVDWTGDEAFERGPGLELLVRDRPLLGLSRPLRPRRQGAHLRRHRSGRVPRAGRRQRLYERHGAVEPAPGCRCGRRALRAACPRASARAGSTPRTRSSTATTPSTGLYEQFAGFFDLEPLVIADLAPRRPIAADLLLGHERVARRPGS